MAARAGVTLVELLIVLAILGIMATLVVPGAASVFRRPASAEPTALTVLDSARRLAVSHGVTVRLRVQPDGLWRVGVPGAAEQFATGRLPIAAGAAAFTDLTVDPLGTCRPAPGWRAAADGAVFDASRCRWVGEGGVNESAQP